jgi:adenylosuccinate lyase
MKTMSKSESIRQHLKVAKDKSPKAVAEALKEKGVLVTPNLVSLIKYQSENGRSKAKAKPRKKKIKALRKKPKKLLVSDILADTRAKGSVNADIQSLLKAKDFIAKAGGVQKAHALLDAINLLIS